MNSEQLRGLVRAVDRHARRHVYGVGARPHAEVAGELGSLVAQEGEGYAPVWLTADGQLVSERPGPSRRPSPRTLARWISEPARWRGDGAAVRARAVARRAQLSLRGVVRHPMRPVKPDGEPVGWLVPESSNSLPLFEAIHPVTGDQLLSTDPDEPARLGYAGRRPLGHLVPTAPVTGLLGVTTPDLPWARRRGEDGFGASQRGLGRIELPMPGETVSREAFVIVGLALFPPGPVARVEIALDGLPAGRARIGLPRMDLAGMPEHLGLAEAPLCGFEFPVTAPQLRPEANHVCIDATAVHSDGRRFALPSRTVLLEALPLEPEDPSGRAAGLRRRTAKLISRAAAPSEAGGLKVLAFAHRLDVGGAQRYFFELLKRLAADSDFSCTVLAPKMGPYTAAIEELGIPVHTSPGLGPGDPGDYEGRMHQLAGWAAPQGFDLVWANTFDASPGADLATRLGIPVVWSLHESFDVAHWWAAMYGTPSAYPYARERAERALREADALVFAADATRCQYERHGRAEHMLTLPYGMELDEIDSYRRSFDRGAMRERLGIPENARVVLSLGRFEPRKGQTLLAQAFAAVAGDHPDALLVLVGDQAGPYSPALHEHVQRAGFGERVRIEPLATDPYAWHAIADLFVLASDIESSPIVVLEAMAFQTPVVATAIFGVPELIEDGVNGYLCEPSDLTSLTDALDRVLSTSSDSRRRVGEAGEHTVRARHDPARYKDRMRTLMSGLATDPEGLPSALLTTTPRPRSRRAVTERVSVLIPTLDAGGGFERSLDAIAAQEGLDGLEVIVVDSGSSDDTVEVARRAGARVKSIPPSEFNHGGTRNLLAAMASGDVLLTTVQDATLNERTALLALVQSLRDEPRLAAVSASQTAGEGADLFSLWHSWLHLERSDPSGEEANWAVDNVCAAIRRSAWEQLHFRELAFAEDLDFGFRAHAAGWVTAFSDRPLVAHHHDRPADHTLSRAAIHRFELANVVGHLDRHPVAALGLEPLLMAATTVIGQLQAAFDGAMPEGTTTSLARCLRRVIDGLRVEPRAAEPTGELALLCDLWGGRTSSVEGDVVRALRDEILGCFEFPWLSQFALAQPESIDRQRAGAFVARFMGSNLGQLIGDALRDAPDSDIARRLRAGAVSAPDERPARPTAAGR